MKAPTASGGGAQSAALAGVNIGRHQSHWRSSESKCPGRPNAQPKSHVAGPDYGRRTDAHLLLLNLAYRRAPGVALGRLNTPAPSVTSRNEGQRRPRAPAFLQIPRYSIPFRSLARLEDGGMIKPPFFSSYSVITHTQRVFVSRLTNLTLNALM
ncbi:hypothetical protein ROHU_017318 [Labeo rohita]|uniref:Uncharacterized protein n=1 Tax=Labeo rohita TaxID=84645 RepID=A0A498NGU5_LABRO|nr:hypothetical protein ROHU_017318 [Labeo rohita]